MKALVLALLVFLCSCQTKPKVVTIAFNGWHGKDFLKQGCIVQQRKLDQLSPGQYERLLAIGIKPPTPCTLEPDVMNRQVENQLLTAFAANPACHGVSVSQGYYGPKDSSLEDGNRFLGADWRLSLDLSTSDQTGDISLAESGWTLNPKILSGSLSDLDKATTQICRIAKGQGAQ